MTSTVFVQGTVITSPWLNDVNTVVYTKVFPDGTPVITGVPTTQVFTATASQTTFTLSNAPSSLELAQVFLNGLRLSPTTDYSIASTTLTLAVGATLADELLVDYFHA
jgi:hypothetical protein